MFYHKFFWYPASLIISLALILSFFFGEAILMGWAHNLGLLLFFSLLVPIKKHWTTLSQFDKYFTLLISLGSLLVFWSWTTMVSPWLFSAYVWLAMCTGWAAYLLGKSIPLSPDDLNKGALFIALGSLPLIALPIYVTVFMDTVDNLQLWTYKMIGFGNIRAVGHFVAIGAMAATAWAWHKGKTLSLWWIAITLLWMVGFWSGSRTGLVAGLLGLIGTSIVCRIPPAKIGLAFVPFFLGGALSLLWPLPTYHFGALDRFVTMQSQITSENPNSSSSAPTSIGDAIEKSGINRASSGRVDMWNRAVDSIMDKPLVGHGLGNWRKDSFNTGDRQFFHLHNIVLDTLHSFGFILGGAMLITLLWGSILALLSAWKLKSQAAFPTAMIFVGAGLSLFDATLWMPYPASILGLSIGSLLVLRNRIEKPTIPLTSSS